MKGKDKSNGTPTRKAPVGLHERKPRVKRLKTEDAVRSTMRVTVPERWDNSFAVHPRRSMKVEHRATADMSCAQWRIVQELLDEGFVLSFTASVAEAVDIAAAVQSHTGVPVAAAYDENDLTVYVVSDDRM